GRPFIAETVFSHWSKLELIDTAGYTVVVHDGAAAPRRGGRAHPRGPGGGPRCLSRAGRWTSVTENKIRQRYRRLWALVIEAVTRCDQATVYDNSAIKGPR